LTIEGSPVKYSQERLALIDAVLLKQVSVIHYLGHQKGDDSIAKGNWVADETAKKAAMREFPASPLLWEDSLLPSGRSHYQPEEAQQSSVKVASWISVAGGFPLKAIYGFQRLSKGRF
jgi:hypothetical protein